MKYLLLVFVLVLTISAAAGTSGSFAGTVVAGPEKSSARIYVAGQHHVIRRVDVRQAKFEYDSDVPASQRKDPVPTLIPPGTSVRILAEQDNAGEWRATTVEILNSNSDDKKPSEPTTSGNRSTSKNQ